MQILQLGSRHSRVLRAPETLYLYVLPKPPGSLELHRLWSTVWNLLMLVKCLLTTLTQSTLMGSAVLHVILH